MQKKEKENLLVETCGVTRLSLDATRLLCQLYVVLASLIRAVLYLTVLNVVALMHVPTMSAMLTLCGLFLVMMYRSWPALESAVRLATAVAASTAMEATASLTGTKKTGPGSESTLSFRPLLLPTSHAACVAFSVSRLL